MSNRGDFDAAIRRLKREANKLRDDQLHAMQDATYVGTTKEQAERNDARRDRVADLVTKIVALYREKDPQTSTTNPDEHERLESIAKGIKEAPDQRTFNGLVSELNDLLAKRKKELRRLAR